MGTLRNSHPQEGIWGFLPTSLQAIKKLPATPTVASQEGGGLVLGKVRGSGEALAEHSMGQPGNQELIRSQPPASIFASSAV